MKFSAALALCAAPLALASTLQVDLMKRGAVDVEVSQQSGSSGSQKSSSDSKSSNNNAAANNNAAKGQQSSTSITEVIILWVNNGGSATTSSVNSAQAVGTAAAATHTVTVGGTAGLVYSPDSVAAAVGDTVLFTFMSANHTATQSAFTTPCEALTGGIDSGFIPNTNNSVVPAPQMAMQVTVATPIWFYCKQKGHCGKGMVFSVNPTANKTQAMFAQMAIAQNGTGTATAITGGSSAAAAAPAASSASSSSSSSSGSSGSMVSSQGTTNSAGVCTCACLCGVASFPSAAQGVGAFGGMSGNYLPLFGSAS
ncbi:putative GPI-anchored cupredoxin [Lachnellula hyalina]|uniref:Putative GPI-anchored cupredoxin n=1 Tax=Lachnellula hyalina TaxID=1316788 RepID=A0A8H8QX32_9HELO|nr:putative GPI-anchored cupredoxin [Lachnellula hyalina]TVY23750.1 putative GPI-anchored cupredoxin [Lachnellula hyalina]